MPASNAPISAIIFDISRAWPAPTKAPLREKADARIFAAMDLHARACEPSDGTSHLIRSKSWL